MKIFLSVVITLIVVALLGGCCLGTSALLYFRNGQSVSVAIPQGAPVAPAAPAAPVAPVAPVAPAPIVPAPVVQNPAPVAPVAPVEPPFVWDGTVGTLGEYVLDGDPKLDGYKVKGAEMLYTCTENFGVFISMDPGTVQAVSTNEQGAVAFVPCKKGEVVKLATPGYWNDNSHHNSVHLFELIKAVPNVEPLDILMALKTADGKPIALYFKADGSHEVK